MRLICPKCRCVADAGKLVGKHLGRLVYACAVRGTLLTGAAGFDDQPHGNRERSAPPPPRMPVVISTAASTGSSSGLSWYIPPRSGSWCRQT